MDLSNNKNCKSCFFEPENGHSLQCSKYVKKEINCSGEANKMVCGHIIQVTVMGNITCANDIPCERHTDHIVQEDKMVEAECQWENCSGGKYCEKHSLEKKSFELPCKDVVHKYKWCDWCRPAGEENNQPTPSPSKVEEVIIRSWATRIYLTATKPNANNSDLIQHILRDIVSEVETEAYSRGRKYGSKDDEVESPTRTEVIDEIIWIVETEIKLECCTECVGWNKARTHILSKLKELKK